VEAIKARVYTKWCFCHGKFSVAPGTQLKQLFSYSKAMIGSSLAFDHMLLEER
jgi:hypothetical protein